MTCVALPCCLVQSFEPPVPAWPVGKTALLEALAEWVRDEARAVGLASRMDGGAAKRYVKMLGQWAGRIGEGQAWAIPRVGADLRRAAREVSARAEDRFDLAVSLYRREVNKEGTADRRRAAMSRAEAARAEAGVRARLQPRAGGRGCCA